MKRRTACWLAGLALALFGAVPSLLAQGPPLGGASPSYRPPGRAPVNKPSAPPDNVLRYSRNLAGDAKPIVVEADHATTWNEGGRVVLLLDGRVFIHQGVVQCRCQRGAIWVDLHARETTGVLKATFYGEGQTQLDTSSE
jgi:hypothetical protein